MNTDSTPNSAAAVPVITVERGEATQAELAAVLAVLLATRSATRSASTGGLPADSTRPSRWTEHSRTRVSFPRPGPHAWRASALPH